jgi:hypothetical protein
MAKEIVVTSVPRGINLGRTGFQVVMRTAGIGADVMSSLERLAVYRHVPEGSGRNPVIYSYRSVRGTTGQLNVLGRTVDAGNDFSNRSNKLAHLLSVDPAELSALRNSSPAAVLAAIEGRLATVWQGGPEERASPFALPSPPVQPAVCRRWEGVTGDAGWAGVLAQRASRGQPSLVIAPDCSPTWCRTLLELFQEVYALLPPDNRWRTTFDTTVIGSSSSLLRGTYGGSPESAAGHAGLLVVDLSSRAPVPANMATDDFVSVARHGPKQSVARGPSRMPNLPPTLEGTAGPILPVGQTTVRQSSVGRHHPPVNPGDFGDEPKSRLHWYILCGVLLAAIVLVGGSVAAWYWLDHVITKGCEERIYAYADADGEKPDDPKSLPTIEDCWRRAFRGENEVHPAESEFPLLLSAMATKKVGKTQVDSIEGRSELLTAVQGVLQGKDVVVNAERLGADITRPKHKEERASQESIVLGWITSREATPAISDIDTLELAINAATEVVAAAFDKPEGDARKKLNEASVDFLWPDRVPPATRPAVMQRFRETIVANEAGLSYADASDTLNNSIEAVVAELKPKVTTPMPAEKNQPTEAELASSAFITLHSKLEKYQPKPVAELTDGPVTLATNLDAEHLTFELFLPSCGNWKPEVKAPSSQDGGQRMWKLMGLPDAPDEHWGTVTLDTAKKELTYKSELASDAPKDHLYIPLRFSPKADQQHELKSITLNSIAVPQKVMAMASEGASCSLYDVLTGDPVALTTSPPLKVDPSLLGAPNVLAMTLDRPGSKDSADFVLETRESAETHSRTIDVCLGIAVSDKNRGQTVWLESLSCDLTAEDGPIRIQLSRGPSKPWNERATRFGNPPSIPLPPREWNGNQFAQLVRVILLDDGTTRTIDELEGAITKHLNKNKRDKMTLEEWRACAFDFLSKTKGPFRAFVEQELKKTHVIPPAHPEPPEAPKATATDAEKATFKEQEKLHQDKLAAIRLQTQGWENGLRTLLYSWLSLRKFLAEADNKTNADARDFTVVLLGIDAWLALVPDGRKEELKKKCESISLNECVTAGLTLQWKWPNNDVLTRVPRFEIKRFETKRPEPNPTLDMPQ